jgi:tetratricopeptide (TPR) repeat protein
MRNLLFFLMLFPFITLARETSTFPGDAAFSRIEYSSAESTYDSVLVAHPNDPQTLWRLARLYVCRGDVAPDNERQALYGEAERYARKCISADERIAEGHTWLAASLGCVAIFEGGKRKIQLANEIKQELDRALLLNPRDDVAYSILGSFYRALGGVSWMERQLAAVFLGSLPSGGYTEADSALHRAIALAPDVLRHRYELALLYLDMDRTDSARVELESVEKLPVTLARDVHCKEHARELLSKL